MKAYVTGATGFIGTHLVRALRERGDDVVCLVRPESNTTALDKLGVETNTSPVLKGVEDSEIVYHLAGVLGKKGIPLAAYQDAHITLTRRLLMRMTEDQKFVYMSTGWVTHPQKPYERTKVTGEKVVMWSGISYMIVRPGFVYGPGDIHHYPLFKWIKRLGRFFPIPGSGRNHICPTYIHDVVTFLQTFGESVYHIAGNPIPMNTFITQIAATLRVGRPFIHIPPVVRGNFFSQTRVWASAARPTPLSDGLKATVEWYKKEGLL